MHDSTSILNLILGSIFIGFGFVIPIVALLKTSDLKKIKFKELFILTAVQALRVAGIFYFILFCIKSILLYTDTSTDIWIIRNKNIMFGSEWLYYWFSPLIILLLTQILWIKKLFRKKAALITVGLLLLVLPSITSERMIIIITSFHRDYLPSAWSFPIGTILMELTLNIIVFIFIVITIMLAGNKFKHIKQ